MRLRPTRLVSHCAAALSVPLALHCAASQSAGPVRDDIRFDAGTPRRDAVAEAQSTPTADASVVSDAGPPPTCYDEGSAVVYITGNPRARQNKCTSKQRVDYIGACFDPTTATDAACALFEGSEANRACLRCMTGPSDNDGPPESFPDPVIFGFETGPGKSVQLLNLIGCQALAAGSPNCAKKLGTLEVCAVSSCKACAKGTAQNDCVAFSKAYGICNDIIAGALCENTIENGRALANAKCGTPGSTFAEYYDKVSTFFCGP
jgi:hypothetical protein